MPKRKKAIKRSAYLIRVNAPEYLGELTARELKKKVDLFNNCLIRESIAHYKGWLISKKTGRPLDEYRTAY